MILIVARMLQPPNAAAHLRRASAASQDVRWSRWFRAHHVVDMLCQGTSGNLSVAF
jgi:hypothetical protein